MRVPLASKIRLGIVLLLTGSYIALSHFHEFPAYIGVKLVDFTVLPVAAWGGFHLVRLIWGKCAASKWRKITEKHGLDFGFHGEEAEEACKVPNK